MEIDSMIDELEAGRAKKDKKAPPRPDRKAKPAGEPELDIDSVWR